MGETTKTISIAITGETVVEADETFAVNLSAAVGATIADATAQGTLVNDDVTSPGGGGSGGGGGGKKGGGGAMDAIMLALLAACLLFARQRSRGISRLTTGPVRR